MFITEDNKEVFAAYFKVLGDAYAPIKILKLKGLNPDYRYLKLESNIIYDGDELMYAGINVSDLKDLESQNWRFKAVK